ncbi:MAG: hypothetical protein IPO01_08040 [Chitinophagaceae bacterium]|nr:hypothetical protein [Chitinophagaceae bacterium]MBL0201509.1 hypothetical protein [Chitinophagaceae bacterium]
MYKNYKDEDIIRAYSTMMSTSGEINPDLANAIQNRGGIDYFKRIMELRKSQPLEISRLQNEVQSLTTPETNYDFVRNLISSKYLSVDDLNIFVKRVFDEQRASLIDKAITQTTIVKSLTGLIFGSIFGTLFWWGILYIFKQPFIFVIPVVFMIGYFIIKRISKQSFKNPVVLVASVLSAIISLVAGQFLFFGFNS